MTMIAGRGGRAVEHGLGGDRVTAEASRSRSAPQSEASGPIHGRPKDSSSGTTEQPILM